MKAMAKGQEHEVAAVLERTGLAGQCRRIERRKGLI